MQFSPGKCVISISKGQGLWFREILPPNHTGPHFIVGAILYVPVQCTPIHTGSHFSNIEDFYFNFYFSREQYCHQTIHGLLYGWGQFGQELRFK
jgi:hypothetical protein